MFDIGSIISDTGKLFERGAETIGAIPDRVAAIKQIIGETVSGFTTSKDDEKPLDEKTLEELSQTEIQKPSLFSTRNIVIASGVIGLVGILYLVFRKK